jgi:DNA-binding CsgD family transcriptional regulator
MRPRASRGSQCPVRCILGISVKTVETHRAHIMLKLSCESIAEFVRYAVRNLMVAP